MIDKMPSPILITGARRSGTSMIAGILKICGAFGGNSLVESNYENHKIRNQLFHEYMRRNDLDIKGQFPFLPTKDLEIPRGWREKVERIILEDGYTQGPWMIKDFRLALTWPAWHYAYPNAKWVIVRRRTGDVVQSCLKTAYMQAFQNPMIREMIGVESEADGWRWWVAQYEDRFVEMVMEGLNCRVIWPERMIHGDYQQIFELVDWLGLKWNSKALEYVDPKFWKARIKEKESWQGQQ
jgi:hypothetical protein